MKEGGSMQAAKSAAWAAQTNGTWTAAFFTILQSSWASCQAAGAIAHKAEQSIGAVLEDVL